MAYDKFLIAPLNSGLTTDTKPWMISDDSYESLENAYSFRGRIRKRYGSQWMGTSQLNTRLRYRPIIKYAIPGANGTTSNVGAAAGALLAPPFVAGVIGDTFDIGGQIFQVTALGTPANLSTTNGAGTGTLDTTTGAYTFLGCAHLAQIYYYQANNFAMTDPATGNATGFVNGSVFKMGQQFLVGTIIFTVISDTPGIQAMASNTVGATGTFNVTTGEYSIHTALLNTAIYFYPLEPVMGITQVETNNLGDNPTYAFDTQFAYLFSGGYWNRSGTALWHKAGSTSNFFWATNWTGLASDQNRLFVSNFQSQVGGAVVATDDTIKYLDHSTATWTDFTPQFLSGLTKVVRTARIILPFKDRLVLLNTIEIDPGATDVTRQYPNRCRFSYNGSPLVPAVVAGVPKKYGHPWLEPNQTYTDPIGPTTYIGAGAGYIDAPTHEEIISAGFIRDRLIVYFERSAWELAYTGNQVLPFVWQKFDAELGSISTFSSVAFDKSLLTVGGTGVHACNGAEVQRIDSKIPDQIFEVRNDNQGLYRVNGIRDFFTEMVYWSYPIANSDPYAQVFPNKVLVYNYKNGSWAINDDTITAMGYYEQESAPTWATSTMTWAEALETWSSGVIKSRFKNILAGNQQGFMVIIDPDCAINAPSLSITNIVQTTPSSVTLTIIDHTLQTGEYINIDNTGLLMVTPTGNVPLDGNNFQITTSGMTTGTILIDNLVLPAQFTYLGGGTIARVSKIDILTKRFNPYIDKGRRLIIAYAEFAVDKTQAGALTVDHWVSSAQFSMLNEAIINGVAMGSGILETYAFPIIPFEVVQDMLWRKVFFQSEGQFVQLRLYFSDDQMLDTDVTQSDFELEGFILNTLPKGDLNGI